MSNECEQMSARSLLFLGGGGNQQVKFRLADPTHHARWMQTGLYALKVFLFRDQFCLNAKELCGIRSRSLYFALIYFRFCNEALRAIKDPRNDLQFLHTLRAYPDKDIAEAAITAFASHLWYLVEHLVGLALFDKEVGMVTRRKVMTNIEREKKSGAFVACKEPQ